MPPRSPQSYMPPPPHPMQTLAQFSNCLFAAGIFATGGPAANASGLSKKMSDATKAAVTNWAAHQLDANESQLGGIELMKQELMLAGNAVNWQVAGIGIVCKE
ncbi:hypothetical protein FOA52_010139 [Chlamydomonas sp. UWO 241]|nr:hypothetical protein FOA52_010139 [Chlamydomonas sp. UWO 241]